MSDSKLTPPADLSAMSLRECRLIVERLLVAAGAHPGLIPSARDAAVSAEILGLGVLRAIFEDEGLIVPGPSARTRVESSDGGIRLHADGLLSLYAAPAVRDLLLEVDPGTEIRVVGVHRPQFLGGIALTPGLESLDIRQDGELTVVRVETDAARAAARVATVRSALRDAQEVGLPADSDLWFGLYVRSNDALAEDTPLSRAHAGYRDVDATGRIVKQMDDDTDLEHALQSRVAS
jgi:hypothetical protein